VGDFKTETLAEGFGFLEGPRWRDGRLWMSDMDRGKVFTLGLDGGVETVVEVPGQPSGLGFLPDGTPLIVSMNDRRLLRLEGGAVTHRVDVTDRRAVACQLGGADGRTLFCLTCEGTWEEICAGEAHARVEVTTVDIPGAGSP
jgi:sugar lactone lactonase YvrE